MPDTDAPFLSDAHVLSSCSSTLSIPAGTGNSATHNIPPPLRYPAGPESVDDFPAFDAKTDEDS